MDSHRYTIKRSFLISLCMVICLLVILLGLSLYYGPSDAELIVLGVTLCASAGVLLERFSRSVTVGPQGLVIRKFMKPREIPWDMVQQAGMMTFRRKCYLILTTGRGFHILSSSYGNFTDLVRNVTSRISPEFVDEAVGKYMEEPVNGRGDVCSVCLAAIVLLALIALKLLRIV
ncbi:MAG: hypothetical protein LBV07_00250 [Syntrophobacterales bacterium]|nr:hypothetical protein [Syntrophobacterales bacterium]